MSTTIEVEVAPAFSKELTVAEHRALTKRVLWKLDLHILPSLTILWLANFVDRSNIGNARIAGLQTDLHLKGNQFNTALAVFYVTYILVELPSNWVLKKVKPNRWIPFLVGAWGLVTTFSGFMQSFGGLVAIRLMLGLCEGGLLCGLMLYLSTMYKRHELQLRVGIFYAAASLSGAFGGLLASAIIQLGGKGGLEGWRWIFIIEGIATVLLAALITFILPANIATAKFLTEEEREFALERLRVEFSSTAADKRSLAGDSEKDADLRKVVKLQAINEEDEEFEWREVIRGLTDLQAWITGIAYLGMIVCLYSFSLFLPTIVSGLGYTGVQAQLHTVPPYVPAAVLTVIIAFFSDRMKVRGPFILACLPLSIIGYILSITVADSNVRYGAVFLIAAGVYPSVPCILSLMPNNTGGYYKKATTSALQLAVANSGGFIATFIYTDDQKPRYIKGHSLALGLMILAWLLVAVNMAYCVWENKARREGRRDQNIERYNELRSSGKTRAPIGDRHPEFVFTL